MATCTNRSRVPIRSRVPDTGRGSPRVLLTIRISAAADDMELDMSVDAVDGEGEEDEENEPLIDSDDDDDSDDQ